MPTVSNSVEQCQQCQQCQQLWRGATSISDGIFFSGVIVDNIEVLKYNCQKPSIITFMGEAPLSTPPDLLSE